MTKRTSCAEGLSSAVVMQSGGTAAGQDASEELTHGITTIPQLRESAGMFCRFRKRQVSRRFISHSSLDIISSFVIRASSF
jgi:hypothetical protein